MLHAATNPPVANDIPARRQPVVTLLWLLTAGTILVAQAQTFYLTYGFAYQPPPRIAAGLAALGWSGDTYFAFLVATIAPLFAVCFGVGIALFLFQPRNQMVVLTSIFLMAAGAGFAVPPSPEFAWRLERAGPLFLLPAYLVGVLTFGLLPLFAGLFPDGRLVPRWMGWVALEGFVVALLWTANASAMLTSRGPLVTLLWLLSVLNFFSCAVAQIWRYRQYSTPLQKQQTKWFVFGVLIMVIVTLPAFAGQNALTRAGVAPGIIGDLVTGVAIMAVGALPLAILIATVRYRLYDIDIIIRRTLQYSLLSAVLTLIYFGSIVLLQSAFGRLTGDSPLLVVLSTLLIAALFQPLRRRMQATIDRRFYRPKYDAAAVLAQFAQTCRDETELAALEQALLTTVERTLRPSRVGMWLRR